MSVQNVRAEIERFLTDGKPQVLCIRGAWGTGKTYTWDNVLERLAQATDKKLPFEKYAKVSLFGLNSIVEIKREIFQATKPAAKIGKEFDPADLKDLYGAGKSSNLVFKALSLLSDNAMDAAIEAASLLARNQLICIDDLERKGADLRSVDVLGFISYLRDVRKCSVVLLLNDEQLEDKPEFESYLEKVVDLYLRFEPTCQEIADIAVPERQRDEVANLVRTNAVRLGITNVRVIQKILRLVRDVQPMISEYSFQVTRSATATITLMGWSYLQPEYAPSLEYLTKMQNMLFSPEDESEQEQKWSEQLAGYGYSHTDEFDLLLLRGVKNGYFVKEEIDKHASDLHRADVRQKAKQEMQALWSAYRDSFISTETELLERFYEVTMRNIENLVISEMLRVEELLREFDDLRASAILDRYIEVNKDKPGAFDLSIFEDYGEQIDPGVRTKLLEASYEHLPDWTPAELLQRLDNAALSGLVIEKVAALPISDYLTVLKSHEGEELLSIIKAFRNYLRIANPTDTMTTILDKAGEALREIAKENRLNHKRAMATGLIQRLEAREAPAVNGAEVAASTA